jgi:mRNA interferase MazF
MEIKQFEVWIADLNPRIGTETEKVRPVVVIQTDLINAFHPSTIVCPISTNVRKDVEVLRIHLKKGTAQLKEDCDILIDQVRAIDNKRLQNKIGALPTEIEDQIRQSLSIIFDI